MSSVAYTQIAVVFSQDSYFVLLHWSECWAASCGILLPLFPCGCSLAIISKEPRGQPAILGEN